MIDLQLFFDFDGTLDRPRVIKVIDVDATSKQFSPKHIGVLKERAGDWSFIEIDDAVISVFTAGQNIVDDVLYLNPASKTAQRWFRSGETQNTLLVTEQCDQLCVMCSQPPKKTHVDYFDHFLVACLLADDHELVGLSGGEPTLHKKALFDLIFAVIKERPSFQFHVLTNGQHFEPADAAALTALRNNVIWGVPIYSADPVKHDEIVGKKGAFDRLQQSLLILGETGASVELRTVILKQNQAQIADLAKWVSSRMPDVSCWAIMQLEKQGYALGRWNEQFYDHSTDFRPIGGPVSFALARGVNVVLYNFPRCTVPSTYRHLCPSTISDWKRHFDDRCGSCPEIKLCSGLFAWHDEIPYENWGYS